MREGERESGGAKSGRARDRDLQSGRTSESPERKRGDDEGWLRDTCAPAAVLSTGQASPQHLVREPADRPITSHQSPFTCPVAPAITTAEVIL